MADETPASDTTSAPTPIDSDEPEDDWKTPGKVRKPRLAARPTFELHAVAVHLPALPSDAPAMLLEILPAFIRAAKLPTHTCADVSVHLRNRNRLAILKTHHIELVSRLLSIESITLAGHTYSVAPYLAAPTNSCRGVSTELPLTLLQTNFFVIWTVIKLIFYWLAAWATPPPPSSLSQACTSRILCTTIGSNSAAAHISLVLIIALSACSMDIVRVRAPETSVCAPPAPPPSTSLKNHIPVLHGAFTVKAIMHPSRRHALFVSNGMKLVPTRQ
ncbi:hypothetical protein MTO96_015127 [Rhipicephalus appendiculatus]